MLSVIVRQSLNRCWKVSSSDHVRGAFTGATQDKLGVFEYANHGTVFLDEIGELPLTAQSKLLRILQNHEIQRVGSPVPRIVDVRVIAATNRDLRAMVNEGTFRKDLYYRLAMIEVKLPGLAERREDLPFWKDTSWKNSPRNTGSL